MVGLVNVEVWTLCTTIVVTDVVIGSVHMSAAVTIGTDVPATVVTIREVVDAATAAGVSQGFWTWWQEAILMY